MSFSFTVTYPAGLSGTQTFSGISAIFRPTGGSLQTVNISNISLTPARPAITSATTASGTVGTAFSYTVTASDSPTSFAASGLPSGLTFNTTSGVISGTPTAAGSSNVSLTATNGAGTGSSTTLVITINAPGSNGGDSGGGSPTITSQPSSLTVTEGGTATFSVAASNATSYQWRKDGAAIAGANLSSYTKANVSTADAGTYTVAVSGSTQTVVSNPAILVVNPRPSATTPVITGQPNSIVAGVGSLATFSVTATGTSLFYQWKRNGIAIGGANGSSYSIAHVSSETAGDYTVAVSNSAGVTTSSVATLTVRAVEYFGTLGSGGGTFAMYIRPDRTGVFLAFARSSKVALVSRDLVMDPNGNFSLTTAAAGVASLGEAVGRTTAAAAVEYTVAGTVNSDGTVSGSIGGLGLALVAPAPAISGATSGSAGFYQSGAVGSTATSYTIVGPAGEAYVAMVTPTGTDAGKGTVDAGGNVSVTTEGNVVVTGSINSNAVLSMTTATPGSGTPTQFSGGNTENRAVERLINVSTRSTAGSGDATLVVGFSVNGSAPKRLLIRGVGPALTQFGVGGVLANPQVKLYSGQTVIAQNVGWSTSADASAIATAAAQVYAFPLATGSKDSALLLYVNPGTYTAQVSSTDGATGIALVEVYEVP